MFSLSKRYLKSIDWIIFSTIILLSIIGLLFVRSATYSETQAPSIFFKKQLFGVISGILIYLAMLLFDHRKLERVGYFLYFATMLLLFFTTIKGSIGLGAQRWVSLGIIKFQPSELAKLFFPAFFVSHLSSRREKKIGFNTFIPILLVLGASALLTLKQPDLGTALILIFSGGVLLWLAGIGKKFFLSLIIILLVSTPLIWKSLKTYQKKRVVVFLGGGSNQKERYQIEQSRIAIGSGGLFGKGYLKGTQNRFNFLPESRTDFIFSIICEELGFIWVSILLFIFALLFLRFF